jgi:hypothetical protein
VFSKDLVGLSFLWHSTPIEASLVFSGTLIMREHVQIILTNVYVFQIQWYV